MTGKDRGKRLPSLQQKAEYQRGQVCCTHLILSPSRGGGGWGWGNFRCLHLTGYWNLSQQQGACLPDLPRLRLPKTLFDLPCQPAVRDRPYYSLYYYSPEKPHLSLPRRL